MHSIKDFCQILNVSPRTMHRYLFDLKPFLKFGGNCTLKRLYTDIEAEMVLEYLKKLKPKRFERQKQSLAAILSGLETKSEKPL